MIDGFPATLEILEILEISEVRVQEVSYTGGSFTGRFRHREPRDPREHSSPDLLISL
jgi:hypothetical protein